MKFEEIKELIRVFEKSKVDKIQVKQKDFEIEMEKNTKNIVVEAAPQPATAVSAPLAPAAVAAVAAQETKTNQISGETITSPMVGTYYASPSPDSPVFVKVGDKVSKGDVLCILEAMKIMNELEAEYDCKILDILVKDGDVVEYDMPLFVVEKA
jgi:acetyl-CoA carboxylase biotin carboxyl carrier protein